MSFPPPVPPGPSHPAPPPSREEPRLLMRRDEPSAQTPRTSFYAALSARRLAARRAREARGLQPGRFNRLVRPRTILRLALGLSALALLLLLGGAAFLRHSMHAALPQLDGVIRTGGLSAPVTVTRDDHGVPSITAANLDDLIFAQGYITAQDRLWQMDALRRHAAGDLAEILGSKLLAHDRTQRTLQIRASADRAVTLLPADQLHQLEAYARGVNAFITQNSDHLPVEFHLLHYTPSPWTPRDTLLVSLAMAQDLSTEFPTKLLRESFSAHLPANLLADLYPVGSWRDHPPSQAVPDMTSPRPEVEQIPLDESQSRLALPSATPQDLLAAKTLLSLQACEGCRSGSNNWAVAGSRSASGQPLVSNDMHLALGVPGIWYEAGLHAADHSLDVAGLTLPGTPFVIVGRNAHVAWAFTNLGGDVQDVYIEHLRNPGPNAEFQQPDGSWAPVQHHPEHIRVRGGMDVTLDVQTTTHSIGTTQLSTPIISPLYPSDHRTLSLAWTSLDPTIVTSPFYAANDADDGPALVAAFANSGAPSLNMVYADDHNHIGYHAIGRIPIRGAAIHHPVATPEDIPTTTAPNEDDENAPPTEEPTQEPTAQPTAFHQPHRRVPHSSRFCDEWAVSPQRDPSPQPRTIRVPHISILRCGHRAKLDRSPQLVETLYRAYRRVPHSARFCDKWAVSPQRDLSPQPRTIRVPHISILRCGRRAKLDRSPQLVETLYRPHRLSRTQRTPPQPQHRRHNKQPAAPTPPPQETPIPAPTPTLNYTIGSPIPAVPVDALDLNAQWTGYIPYAELPAITDPTAGFLATANARITPNDYPYAIALNWAAPYRVERITHLLASASNLTPADMLRMQMDTHSELDLSLAHRIAYALDHTAHKTKQLQVAAEILRHWDGNVSVDAAAPSIVAATRAELLPMLLIPQIAAHDTPAPSQNLSSRPERSAVERPAVQSATKPAEIARLYSWGEQSYVLELLLQHTPKRWLPAAYPTWDDLIADAVQRGLTSAHAPGNLATWSYSKARPVELSHPLLSNPLLAAALGLRTGSGPRIIAGDTSNIKATSRSFGPSERFTADLANPDATTSNVTTGQSGNPASPFFLDQLPHWIDGTTLPLPLHNPQAAHTLTLQP